MQGPFLILLLLLCVGSAACRSPQRTADLDVNHTLFQLRLEHDAAVSAGAAQAALEFYADDLVVMPPNAPAVVGTLAFLQWFDPEAMPFASGSGQSCGDERIGVDGNLAYFSCNFTLTHSPEALSPVTHRGKLVWILRQEGGVWKIVESMWNSDRTRP